VQDIAKQYWENGIAMPLDLMSEAEASEAADKYYAFQKRATEKTGGPLYVKPHLVAPWVYEIGTRPALLDAVEACIGPNILIWCSDVFNKVAGSGKYIGFHQDSKYWGLSPSDKMVSAWIALTPSKPETGNMQVVKGTHRAGILDHKETYHPDNMLSVGQEVEFPYTSADITDVTLNPGQFSLHHLDLIHGGKPNESDTDRIGLVFRFAAVGIRQERPNDAATLVRGTDDGHFRLEPAPKEELGEQELAELNRVFKESPSGFGGMLIG